MRTPALLTPTTTERVLLPSGREVVLPKTTPRFPIVRERKSMTFRPDPEDADPEAEEGELLAQPGDEGEDGSYGRMARTSIRRLCTTGPTNFQP